MREILELDGDPAQGERLYKNVTLAARPSLVIGASSCDNFYEDAVKTIDTWRSEVLARLRAAGDDETNLVSVIRWVDSALCEEQSASSFDPTSYGHQLLARMIAAAGKLLIEGTHQGNIEDTIKAAEAFALCPRDETAASYEHAATASYPFGSGDGCYSIDPRWCEPGSGCVSGAGSLQHVAMIVSAARVMKVLRKDVAPWLKGLRDPLADDLG